MLDQHIGSAGPVGVAAGDGDGADHIQPPLVRVFAWLLDLPEDIEGPERGYVDGDLWVLQIISAAELLREQLFELGLGEAGGLNRARERQRDAAAGIYFIFARQLVLAVDGDFDFVPRL